MTSKGVAPEGGVVGSAVAAPRRSAGVAVRAATVRAVAGLAAAGMVTGCVAGPPPTVQVAAPLASTDAPAQTVDGPTVDGPVGFEEMAALGDALTQALASGDVEQWMAHTALEGDAAQQQRDWFAGVQAVPMDVREMHPTFLVRADDSAGGALTQFAFRHQITGVDAVPVIELYEVTLVPVDGQWRIGAVTGAGTSDTSYPQEWDEAATTVIEGEHSIVIAGVDDGLTPEIAASLDDAVGAALVELRTERVDRLFVEFSDVRSINTFYGQPEEDDWVSWFYYFPLASAEVERDGHLPDVEDGDYGAARLKLNGEAVIDEFAASGRVSGGSVLTREAALTTLLLADHHAAPPAWVVAGLPLWFSYRGDRLVWEEQVSALEAVLSVERVGEALPAATYEEFAADPVAYEAAAAFFWFLDETHGRDAAVALALGLMEVDAYGTDAEEEIDAQFLEHLGVGQAELEEQWADWVDEEFGQ